MSKPTEPLRGDAKWKAAKKGVADRNEAAFARGRQERTQRDAARAARVTQQQRDADRNLPRMNER